MMVVAVVAILGLAAMLAMRPAASKARDSRRKSDLQTIAKGIESYYDDHQGYPDAGLLATCGTVVVLTPYIGKVPCDPTTNDPYGYQIAGTGKTNARSENVYPAYRLYAQLENASDPQSIELKCMPNCGGTATGYNYGVASGVAVKQ